MDGIFQIKQQLDAILMPLDTKLHLINRMGMLLFLLLCSILATSQARSSEIKGASILLKAKWPDTPLLHEAAEFLVSRRSSLLVSDHTSSYFSILTSQFLSSYFRLKMNHPTFGNLPYIGKNSNHLQTTTRLNASTESYQLPLAPLTSPPTCSKSSLFH